MVPHDLFDNYLELRQYIGLSDYDIERVRAARPLVVECFSQLVDDFYRQVNARQTTRRFLVGGREQIRQLKQTLLQWLNDLFESEYDQAYVTSRWRIGQRHVAIGIAQPYVHAAFSRLRSGLITSLIKNWRGTIEELEPTVGALGRVLDIEQSLMDLAYQSDFETQSEAALAIKISNERLRAIVNTCVDAIISIRVDGTIDSFNPAAERLFGYLADEIMGHNISALMPEPYRTEHDGYIRRYLATGEARIIGIGREVRAQRKDGSTFPADVAVSQIDHLQMFIGIVRDISERKRTEQRLLHSERLAAIGQMITGLAHESRNAFQRSQAALELLELEVGRNADAAELIQRIQRALDHLYYLYEEVRDYAAPLQLRRRPHDLSRIWQRTWNDLEVSRHGKTVQLREIVDGIDLVCNVDDRAIEQLFRNILENAIVACGDPGNIAIQCADALVDGADALLVSVRDNGPGLDADASLRVFEPFFTTKTKGTGLGMAIARRIVEAHGGVIELGNPPQQGAEFLVTLPRR